MQKRQGLDALGYGKMAKPSVGAGEVLVRVVCAGLNPVDFKLANGGMNEWVWPHVPGVDVAGVVEEVGARVDEVIVGDRVMLHNDIRKQGGLAEYVVGQGHTVSRLPEGIGFVEAAALPCAGMTALLALDRKVGMVEGQSILVQAGAGGVGGFAIQLAKLGGMHVLTTCSGRNVEYVKQLGADVVIDYTKGDVLQEVKAVTGGEGVDVVLDLLGGDAGAAAMEMVRFGGHVAYVVGVPDLSGVYGFVKGYSAHAITLGGAYLSGDWRAQCDLAEMGEELLEMVDEGVIDPLVEEVIGFGEAVEGLRRLSGGHVRGKIVVQVGEG
ncbi:zinc-binding dehydrogenase [Poriferisphaera sp. WC338]|uniref:zinc-binding dehydrogenase n=1 Tax=Poriferisphaera sp. WC338 TaxID=3425129 RepID=UPI003D81491C